MSGAQVRLPGSLDRNRRLSQWLSLQADGRVIVTPGKVEIGQGILTALAQIAAEELDVTPARIEMHAASTAGSPDEGVTSGSRSIVESGLALRHVCAAARAIHLSVAAQRAGVPFDSITVRDGSFIGADGTAFSSYWAQAELELLECEAPASVRIKPSAARSVAGTAVPRLDLPDKVFGAPRFIHDVRLPGMRFACVLRPPSRGARLVSRPEHLHDAAIVQDGNFLAVVHATPAGAEAALARLAGLARWEEQDTLPEQGALKAYLRGAPVETTVVAEHATSVQAARVLRAETFRPYISHASIGLVCAIACLTDGRLEVWSQSQSIFNLRRDLGLALGMPQEAVAVHHREGAGCYGHNGADDVALDAALIARALPGVPVRVQWSRADELGWAPFAPPMLISVEAGLGADGSIVHWRQSVLGNGHMSRPGTGATPSMLAASHLAEPFAPVLAVNPPLSNGGGAERNAIPGYDVGGLHVEVRRLLEMPLRVSSFRGLGAMGNVLAIESMMEELAEAAGCDPIAYRLRHLADPRARETVQAVVALSGWPGPPRREGVGWGLGYARYKNTSAYCAVVAEIEAQAEIRVRRLWIAADAGELINPEGAAHQIEGGAVQACSIALKEEVRFDRRMVTSNSWEAYPILRFSEVPDVSVQLLPRPDLPPLGVGECSTGPTVAAIANAIHDALGVRVRTMPFTAAQIAAEMT